MQCEWMDPTKDVRDFINATIASWSCDKLTASLVWKMLEWYFTLNEKNQANQKKKNFKIILHE